MLKDAQKNLFSYSRITDSMRHCLEEKIESMIQSVVHLDFITNLNKEIWLSIVQHITNKEKKITNHLTFFVKVTDTKNFKN